MSEPVVVLDHVSKRFCVNVRAALRYGVADIAAALAGARSSGALRPHEFWAVRDVSLAVRAGECLGVVGRNGAGKSTLLRLIGGKLHAECGTITKRGHVGLLLDADALLNPAESGRETIVSFGVMHGLSPAEARRATDPIAAFAELGAFLDAPTGSYSSGMRARLSFAAVTHFATDVLLIDEMLAVGDIGFRRKCVNHLRRFLDRGGALIIVSHDLYPLQFLSDRLLLLEGGVVLAEGAPREVLERYFALVNGLEENADAAPDELQGQPAASPVTIESMSIDAADGGALRTGCRAVVTLRYRAEEAVAVSWGFNVATGDRTISVTTGTGGFGGAAFRLRAGGGELAARIDRLPLAPGTFTLRGALVEYDTRAPLDDVGWQRPGRLFTVAASLTDAYNLHSIVHDLVTIEAEFERSGTAAALEVEG